MAPRRAKRGGGKIRVGTPPREARRRENKGWYPAAELIINILIVNFLIINLLGEAGIGCMESPELIINFLIINFP